MALFSKKIKTKKFQKNTGDSPGGSGEHSTGETGERGEKSFCSPGTGEQNRSGELPFPTLVYGPIRFSTLMKVGIES